MKWYRLLRQTVINTPKVVDGEETWVAEKATCWQTERLPEDGFKGFCVRGVVPWDEKTYGLGEGTKYLLFYPMRPKRERKSPEHFRRLADAKARAEALTRRRGAGRRLP